MLRQFIVLICLVSFFPMAAGAQEVALLRAFPAAGVEQPAPALGAPGATSDQESLSRVNLTLSTEKAATILAANDTRDSQGTAAERPRKTHTGLTFKEFCDVHFGEYRWVYWVGAIAAIVAIHVVAAD